MKAKDCPETKALCQLVDQALAAAAEEVIDQVVVVVGGGGVEDIADNPEEAPAEEPVVGRKKKKDIAEEPPAEGIPTIETAEGESGEGERLPGPEELTPGTGVEPDPEEEAPHVRTALDLECMEKLKEAHRWCEETEIYGT